MTKSYVSNFLGPAWGIFNLLSTVTSLTCKIEVQYTFASLTSENAMYSANYEIPREIKNLTGVKIRTRNLPTQSCLLVAVPIRTVVVGHLLSHQIEIFGNIFVQSSC